jgi:hypothetical protein
MLASTMQFTNNKQTTSPPHHQHPRTHPHTHPKREQTHEQNPKPVWQETSPAKETPAPHHHPHNVHAAAENNGPFPQDPTVCPANP